MLVIVVQEAEPSLGLPEALLAALLRAQVQEVLLHASYIRFYVTNSRVTHDSRCLDHMIHTMYRYLHINR